MKSSTRVAATSDVEIANIDAHGISVHVRGKEYFLPYNEYPWFKDARVNQILKVELHHGHHLHWPSHLVPARDVWHTNTSPASESPEAGQRIHWFSAARALAPASYSSYRCQLRAPNVGAASTDASFDTLLPAGLNAWTR